RPWHAGNTKAAIVEVDIAERQVINGAQSADRRKVVRTPVAQWIGSHIVQRSIGETRVSQAGQQGVRIASELRFIAGYVAVRVITSHVAARSVVTGAGPSVVGNVITGIVASAHAAVAAG